MQSVRIRSHGGPEVLRIEEHAEPPVAAGDVFIRVHAAGVNFYDTQLRSGFIHRPLPIAPGSEGAGTVERVGPNTPFEPGDRVAWAQSPGSYATHAVVRAERLVKIPDALSFEDAAAVLFQGLTAHHLACSTYPLGSGDAALVHSAAGGVGGLLCQIARMRGARVLGAVSTPAKAATARAAGAESCLIYGVDDIAASAKRFADGLGVHVVYDAVGKETFASSLAALRPRGFLVVYGEASGFVPPFDVRELSNHGSLFLTRTALSAYIATPAEFVARASDVLAWAADGTLRVRIHAVYPLERADEAHRALESRETTGKILLRCL